MLKRKEFILGAAAGLTLAAAATAGGVITWPGAHAEPQAVNRITPVPANGDAFTPRRARPAASRPSSTRSRPPSFRST